MTREGTTRHHEDKEELKKAGINDGRKKTNVNN